MFLNEVTPFAENNLFLFPQCLSSCQNLVSRSDFSPLTLFPYGSYHYFPVRLVIEKQSKLSGIDNGCELGHHFENIQLILGDWLLPPEPSSRNPQLCHQGECLLVFGKSCMGMPMDKFV